MKTINRNNKFFGKVYFREYYGQYQLYRQDL